ncbi:MAG: tetratricopeptide repeat protein [Betaproteobacteria bacterium]
MSFNTAIAWITLAAGLLVPIAGATAATESALVAQGDRQWAEGQLDNARKSFEKAVADNPRSVEAHMKLGGLMLSRQQYSDAIQTYQKTISLDGNNARAWIGLGMAYLHIGNKELSRAAFNEAIRIEPARKAKLAKLTESPAKD